MKFCAIHFAKLLTRFPFSEQVHCQSKHPVEQALPSIYDSAGGRFPRQASNFVKQSSNSNMKHHEENVLSSKPNFVNRFRESRPVLPDEDCSGPPASRRHGAALVSPLEISSQDDCSLRMVNHGQPGRETANFGKGTGPRRD